MIGRIVLVKHAWPAIEPGTPPRDWHLGAAGRRQARRLAERLRPFLPFALVCSREPKAHQTAEIVGAALGLAVAAVAGLEEFDRPALPWLSTVERERLAAQIFADLSAVTIGRESGAQARERFAAALAVAAEAADQADTLVAVSHGTVISLFVAAHNALDPLDLWRRLECGSWVELHLPGFRLARVGDAAEV